MIFEKKIMNIGCRERLRQRSKGGKKDQFFTPSMGFGGEVGKIREGSKSIDPSLTRKRGGGKRGLRRRKEKQGLKSSPAKKRSGLDLAQRGRKGFRAMRPTEKRPSRHEKRLFFYRSYGKTN